MCDGIADCAYGICGATLDIIGPIEDVPYIDIPNSAVSGSAQGGCEDVADQRFKWRNRRETTSSLVLLYTPQVSQILLPIAVYFTL